jgi:Mg2+/Co2+ transporter CorC
MSLPKRYNPHTAEPHLLAHWQAEGTYHFQPGASADPYIIDTPPPTVSGHLHLGHVYSYSHADFMARFWRMNGRSVLYPMGYDDNGLPTERLVERRLNLRAAEIGREAFIEKCLQVSEEAEKDYEALWQRLDTHGGHSKAHSPAEIEILVTESHEGGLLDDEKRQMLRNAFRMRELTARQVMVHRTRIIAAPVESSVVELMQIALKAGHTRIPLFQDTIDTFIGFVHIKDVFRLHVFGKENLAEILRDVVYVPETMPIVDVWETLSDRRQYMAVVFDEFGGTAGLITFEDLIEEIFGELQDEFDDESALMSLDAEGRIYLRGDLLVSDVNEYLNLDLPDVADTLGGLILSELGRPPEVGDEIKTGNMVVRVESMDDLSVQEVSLLPGASNVISSVGEWEIADHE